MVIYIFTTLSALAGAGSLLAQTAPAVSELNGQIGYYLVNSIGYTIGHKKKPRGFCSD
jgi:hypothetical protein